jgi:hypothetical protein
VAPAPLTHHEILELIEPFVKSGHHVDLAASNRLERRLQFRSRDIPAAGPGILPLQETLLLDNVDPGFYKLVRVLRWGALAATLELRDSKPDALLRRIADIQAGLHFRESGGSMIAFSYRLESDGELTLTQGLAGVSGLTLTVQPSAVRGLPADFSLKNTTLPMIPLPEDLLAVLGWHWSRLIRSDTGWKGELRVRGHGRTRTRRIEQRLEQAAAHLAKTLGEPPMMFHERWLMARWRVYLRRATPLLACVALIAGAAAVPKLHFADSSAMRMLIFNAPTLLLMLFFCLREVPTIELPPMPRRSSAPAWREAQSAAMGSGSSAAQAE